MHNSLFLAAIADPGYNNYFLTSASLQFYKHGSENLIFSIYICFNMNILNVYVNDLRNSKLNFKRTYLVSLGSHFQVSVSVFPVMLVL